jgi:hypothetical protein
VAMTTASEGTETVVRRWYDAVVLGEEDHAIRLGSLRTARCWRNLVPGYLPASTVPVRTCPPGSRARTGGSPVPLRPERRTPTSSWVKSRSSTPSMVGGTPSGEPAWAFPSQVRVRPWRPSFGRGYPNG